ncbi:MAG: LysR family transcriptional regulator, partial [Myxococcales bacterium]|nr:LysR family transcriptional regulator [Myxococcales bacterium]
MSHDLPETSELAAFVAVVDAGSVSGAADELGLPRATVSRRLARLEERLGVRLLRRTTRRTALTDAGTELYGHARTALAAVGEGWAALRRADGVPRGLLRVSVPPVSGELTEVLLAFVRAFPEVRLEVEVSTRHVDLIGEGFDVAVRASGHLDPGLVARQLARFRSQALASPAYVERHGLPSTAEELRDHACLLGFDRGVRPVTWWPLLDGGRVRVDGRLVCNDIDVLWEATRQGLGI